MRAIHYALIIVFFLMHLQVSANDYSIKKATSAITIDGVLNEADWQNAIKSGSFTQNYPVDTGQAQHQTDVFLTHDDKNLYVAAICYHDPNQQVIVESLRRDFIASRNDGFALFINPLNDLRTGFAFLVSPYGSLAEGTIATGGAFGYSLAWDNRWFAETERHEDHWIVEMAIPFKTLRYDASLEQWSINFARNSLAINEASTWSKVPQGFNLATLAYSGKLNWENPPEKAGSNISIIPYVTTGANVRYTYEDKNDVRHLTDMGADAKIAVSSSLNLDLTVNPDFSQVEVDDQVINLNRFSIFLPEKRNFFLENDDLFGRFGFSKIRPFFSRKIGLSSGMPVPILAGARLSGNVNEDWRVGGMLIQTEGLPADENRDGIQSQNFMVGAFQRKILGVSNIAGILVNRQAFNGFQLDKGNYNTLIGLDYNIADKKDRVRGKLFFHQTFKNGAQKDAFANASWLRYRTKKLYLEWNHEYVGDNYNADVGFVPRINYFRLEPIARYTLFLKDHPKINNLLFDMYQSYYLDKDDWLLTDRVVKPGFEIRFHDYSTFVITYRDLQTRLLEGETFDPTLQGDTFLAEGNYFYRTAFTGYESDFRGKFSYYANIQAGSYYIGNILSYNVGGSYRFRPWGSFSLDFVRNEIRFPEPYNDGYLTLIGSKLDVSFTKNIFLATFIQYNTTSNNFSINSRFQWRFKPMSDLFIVYTENYTDNLAIRNRAFVVKLNYWFSL